MLRLVAVRAELEGRHLELVARAGELQASRDRLIHAQDTERRRLERDIHDGAQQHLVALAVNLRVAQTIAASSPERAARMLGEQAEAARVAIATLSSLSRGIYPRIAVRGGPDAGSAGRGGEQRDSGDSHLRPGGTTPGTGRSRAVLLLHGSSPERREALRRGHRGGAAQRGPRYVAAHGDR